MSVTLIDSSRNSVAECDEILLSTPGKTPNGHVTDDIHKMEEIALDTAGSVSNLEVHVDGETTEVVEKLKSPPLSPSDVNSNSDVYEDANETLSMQPIIEQEATQILGDEDKSSIVVDLEEDVVLPSTPRIKKRFLGTSCSLGILSLHRHRHE